MPPDNLSSFGIPDIRYKISRCKVDMTFVNAAWQLK